MFTFAFQMTQAFVEGFKSGGRHKFRHECAREDKAMHECMEEGELDTMLSDSFPASDAVARY